MKNLFFKVALFFFFYLAVFSKFAPVYALPDLSLASFSTCWEVVNTPWAGRWNIFVQLRVTNQGNSSSAPSAARFSFYKDYQSALNSPEWQTEFLQESGFEGYPWVKAEAGDIINISSIDPGQTKTVSKWIVHSDQIVCKAPSDVNCNLNPTHSDCGLGAGDNKGIVGYGKINNGASWVGCTGSSAAILRVDAYEVIDEGSAGEANNWQVVLFPTLFGSGVPGREGYNCNTGVSLKTGITRLPR
ncbi:MAG: hypothetical protein ABII08_04865 [Candidatus Beckwithbacteria bacterium]